jgi:cytochrome b561
MGCTWLVSIWIKVTLSFVCIFLTTGYGDTCNRTTRPLSVIVLFIVVVHICAYTVDNWIQKDDITINEATATLVNL